MNKETTWENLKNEFSIFSEEELNEITLEVEITCTEIKKQDREY